MSKLFDNLVNQMKTLEKGLKKPYTLITGNKDIFYKLDEFIPKEDVPASYPYDCTSEGFLGIFRDLPVLYSDKCTDSEIYCLYHTPANVEDVVVAPTYIFYGSYPSKKDFPTDVHKGASFLAEDENQLYSFDGKGWVPTPEDAYFAPVILGDKHEKI